MSTLKVLNNTIQIFSTLMNLKGEDLAKNIQLNATLCMLNPTIFDGVPFLTGPVELIEDKVYMARSMKFKTQFNLKTIQELKGIEEGFDPALQVIDELVGYIADLKSKGLTYIPYIPIIIDLGVEDGTLQHVVTFRTRHAILEEPNQ
jgi:hypothetical protein